MGNAVWHAPCFTCSDCGELLVDLHYFCLDGKLYCGRDYAKAVKKPRCKACDELIFDIEHVGAGSFFYHVQHFCCIICDVLLGGDQKYFTRNSNLYCVPCYGKENSKVCYTCHKAVSILEQRLEVGSNVYHKNSECFRCGKCDELLEGKRVYTTSQIIVCPKCK